MERVWQALESRLDPASSAPLAVAFSGGSDSLALLLLAKAWADRAARPILALTVDHGLHAQSGAWTDRARDVAARLGVAFRALPWTGSKPTTGVPAAARAARHHLLADAAREAGAGVILLGHTFDDQLENALMRGAGERLGALRPWSPSPVWPQGRGLFLCRPLLAERRADLQTWLAARGWSWIDDPANASPASPRARARLRVAAGDAADPPPIEDATALTALAGACRALPWGGLVLPRSVMAEQAAALRLLQTALACASGREALPRPERARLLLRRIAAGEAFTATLGGARIEAAREVRVMREAGEFKRFGGGGMTLAAGRAQVWDGRFELIAGRSGLTVQPLQGFAARLAPAQKTELGQIARGGRGALPAVQGDGLPPFCPLLGASSDAVRAKDLAPARFFAACGLVRQERESSCAQLMADSLQPSYVSFRAKGLSE